MDYYIININNKEYAYFIKRDNKRIKGIILSSNYIIKGFYKDDTIIATIINNTNVEGIAILKEIGSSHFNLTTFMVDNKGNIKHYKEKRSNNITITKVTNKEDINNIKENINKEETHLKKNTYERRII